MWSKPSRPLQRMRSRAKRMWTCKFEGAKWFVSIGKTNYDTGVLAIFRTRSIYPVADRLMSPDVRVKFANKHTYQPSFPFQTFSFCCLAFFAPGFLS